MTSWQDQPPLTRRQVRENERAAERELESTGAEPVSGSRRAVTVAPTQAGDVPNVATPYSFSSTQRDDETRSQVDVPPMRPRAPRYEDLSFDSLLAASHAGGPANAAPSQEHAPAPVTYAPTPATPTPAIPAQQSAQPRVEPVAPVAYPAPVSYTPPAPSVPSAPAFSAPISAAPVSAGPAPSVPVSSNPQRAVVPDERPLTRRELRAMMRAQQQGDADGTEQTPAANAQRPAAVAPSVAPAAPPAPVVSPPSAAQPAPVALFAAPQAPSAPMAAVSPLQAQPVSARPAVPAAQPDGRSAAPETSSFADLINGRSPASSSVASPLAVPASPLAPEAYAAPAASLPAPVAAPTTPLAPEVRQSAPAQQAPARPAGQTTGPTTDPQLRARAAGHWSTMNDDDASSGSRSVMSAGSVTTANALILPTSPVAGLATSPLTSTGEVIVTGSIDLPRSLGSTGQHPDLFDSSDIDRLFDETDAAPASSSVAPVRASKAVATHTSTRGMITPTTKRGNKLPVALAVTAAFLAIGVAALLVAGYVFHAF